MDQFGPCVEKSYAGSSQQVLQHAAHREVDVKCFHVDRHRADCLITIDENLCALGMRDACHSRNIQLGAVAIANVGNGHELRIVVDGALEALERNIAVGGGWDMDDTSAALFLRVPNVCIRGKFEVADDDLVAPRAEFERAGQGVYSGRGRRRHRYFIGYRIQELSYESTDGFVLRGPQFPIGTCPKTLIEVLLEGILDAIGERTIGA